MGLDGGLVITNTFRNQSFRRFCFKFNEESPVPQIVNTHNTYVLHVLNQSQKPNAGKTKMTNPPLALSPLHPNQIGHKLIGSKHVHALPTQNNVDKLGYYLTGYHPELHFFFKIVLD